MNIYVIIILISVNNIFSTTAISAIRRKEKRFAFPEASTVGILAAVAIPLGLAGREVFFSYNFEANYNSPGPEYFHPDYLAQIFGGTPDDSGRSQGSFVNETQPIKHKSKKKHKNKKLKNRKKSKKAKHKQRRSGINRRMVYKSFIHKLNTLGFNGRECLLRTICEAAESPLGLYNGVLGDIIHVILTPTTSEYEGIPQEYYDAQYIGNLGNCTNYYPGCPEGILDYFSIYHED